MKAIVLGSFLALFTCSCATRPAANNGTLMTAQQVSPAQQSTNTTQPVAVPEKKAAEKPNASSNGYPTSTK